jgi:O-antigen ligase
MAAMSVGAALVAIALLINLKKQDFKVEFKRKEIKTYFYLSICLFVACALSLLYAKINPLSINGRFSEVHFFSDIAKVWYLFWPIFLVVALRQLTDQQRKKIFQSWMWAFVVLSVLGVFQYFFGWPRPHRIPGNEERFHAVLFMGHHLSVTSIFIFPFFLALDLKKYIWAALGCLLLFLTYSRMIWVALPIGLLVWSLRSLPLKKALAALGILIVVSFTAYQQPAIQKRLHDGLGVDTRKLIWEKNIDFFKQRPMTGVGWMHNHDLYGIYLEDKSPSKWNFVGHAHNNLIQMLSGTGILGTAAWLAWAIFVVVLAWKLSPGIFAAWVVFHINGLTQVNFWEAKVQHQMAWVIALLLFGNFWMKRGSRG